MWKDGDFERDDMGGSNLNDGLQHEAITQGEQERSLAVWKIVNQWQATQLAPV